MELRQLRLLVRRGESEQLEFKTKVNHPEKIIREIIAFANTKGGHLLVGVADNGELLGLKDAQEEHLILENAIQKYCAPKIPYKSEIIQLTDKKAIIIYTIFESKLKPHFAVDKHRGKWRKGYIRVADRSVQASNEMKEILRRARTPAAVKFTYGNNEQLLMKYLEHHDVITLKNFVQLAGIEPTLASKTLVTLVLARVLEIIPQEGEDLYRFNTANLLTDT